LNCLSKIAKYGALTMRIEDELPKLDLGLCLSSGDIDRLMMMMMMTKARHYYGGNTI
jgi:hypothetical protein